MDDGPMDRISYVNLDRTRLRLRTIILDRPKIRLWNVNLDRQKLGLGGINLDCQKLQTKKQQKMIKLIDCRTTRSSIIRLYYQAAGRTQ